MDIINFIAGWDGGRMVPVQGIAGTGFAIFEPALSEAGLSGQLFAARKTEGSSSAAACTWTMAPRETWSTIFAMKTPGWLNFLNVPRGDHWAIVFMDLMNDLILACHAGANFPPVFHGQKA